MSWTAANRPQSQPQSSARVTEGPTRQRPKESYRETIESIVVAFILALLIRGFAAEAFVIPTGSMAPTLMGRHKEIDCPQCEHRFAVNAAEESRVLGRRVVAGTCPNCAFRVTSLETSPSFNGDRILVMKFPYDLPWLPGARPPELGDVVVFHYPETPEQNYIKRLVGLPETELMIHGGDTWSRPLGSSEPFRVQRFDLIHQRALEMLVHDDRHRPIAFKDRPEWRRWNAPQNGDWSELAEHAGTYAPDPSSASEWSWLRYQHLVPSPSQWDAALSGDEPSPPQPSLITDRYAYNSNQSDARAEVMHEPHWVGDLTVHFTLEVEVAKGHLVIELIKAGVPHRCTIDLTNGEAILSRDGEDLGEPQPTPIQGAGTYRLAFANVNDRLTLWVNGKTPFGAGIEFERDLEIPLVPTLEDLAPVGIGVTNSLLLVRDLVLNRDIYYTLKPHDTDYDRISLSELPRIFVDPDRFEELGRLREPRTFEIHPGRYMMMGDNSPRSKDSRAWSRIDTLGGYIEEDFGRGRYTDPWSEIDREPHEVPEELLIGKAFFVYWPHGKPFGPDIRLGSDLRVPFRPYFERMKWIR